VHYCVDFHTGWVLEKEALLLESSVKFIIFSVNSRRIMVGYLDTASSS